jgi:hypothetical protein
LGLWTAEEEEESSYYKELKNLVDTVFEEARAGRLRDCENFSIHGQLHCRGLFLSRELEVSPLACSCALAAENGDDIRHDHPCHSHFREENDRARH